MIKIPLIVILVIVKDVFSHPTPQKPNIVIFMADDMGSYDASFRGSNQFITPNIDALAYNGIILDRFYTPAMCTPSRASMMTGKYPFKTGMQNWVVTVAETYALGLENKLMSNYFQEAGYKTHLVGKWHLGHFQRKYTPNNRGFDSFFGYYNGLIDYYNYSVIDPGYNTMKAGYDFRRNFDVNYDVKNGSYATDLFTNEAMKVIQNHDKTQNPLFLLMSHLAPHTGNDYELLQAPKEEIEKFKFIKNADRQKLGAMISKLDDSIGRVVAALKNRGMLKNTIILFYSDNGAPSSGLFQNAGSNYPLRGQKRSAWDGACRNLGLIYSPLIKKNQRVFQGYFHTVDILPTLAGAAGIKVSGVDGINQWKVLADGGIPKRKEVPMHLDDVDGFSGLIVDDWKLVNGTVRRLNGTFDTFLGDIEEFPTPANYSSTILNSFAGQAIEKTNTGKLTAKKIQTLRSSSKIDCNNARNPFTACNLMEKPCLFNIISDPCERQNMAEARPAVLAKMLNRLAQLKSTAIPSRRPFVNDPNCDPDLHNGTWSPWIADSVF